MHSDADLDLRGGTVRDWRFCVCRTILHLGAAHSGGAIGFQKSSPTFAVAGVKKLKTGDPLQESTDVGPLIRESDAIRASDWVQEAVRGGARLLMRWTAQGRDAGADAF